MAPLQHRFLGQAKFAGELCAGLPLQHSTQEEHDMGRDKLAPREDRAAVDVINALALVTAPHGQAAPTIDAKEARLRARCAAVGTLQPARMEMLLQPSDALVVIEKVDDWKVHVADLTSFALLV